MVTMNQEWRRSIILEHYQNPVNKGLIDDNSYEMQNMNNESCIDEVNLQVKFDGDTIEEIRFDGEACAICTSSTSIMVQTLMEKSIEEAEEIIENFENMIDEREYDRYVLEEAYVYCDIPKQPNRKKCALLSWWGMKKILERKK